LTVRSVVHEDQIKARCHTGLVAAFDASGDPDVGLRGERNVVLVLDLKEPVQVVCREYQSLSRKRRCDIVRIWPLPYAEISVRTTLGDEMEPFQVPRLASGDCVDGHLALAYTSGNAAQGV